MVSQTYMNTRGHYIATIRLWNAMADSLLQHLVQLTDLHVGGATAMTATHCERGMRLMAMHSAMTSRPKP